MRIRPVTVFYMLAAIVIAALLVEPLIMLISIPPEQLFGTGWR